MRGLNYLLNIFNLYGFNKLSYERRTEDIYIRGSKDRPDDIRRILEQHDGNNIYLYPKNGHYYFKRKIVRCKDKTTGEWYNAVLYSDANGQYVREVKDFNTKFKLCQ